MSDVARLVEWKNQTMEAWRLDDGTLVVRRRIDKPMDGHDHYFLIDALETAQAVERPIRGDYHDGERG